VPEIAKSQVSDALSWFAGGEFGGIFKEWLMGAVGVGIGACLALNRK
jgi:hypothetical protein